MTLLHRIRARTRLRGWLISPRARFIEWTQEAKLSRINQDIHWARISSDAHITELVRQRDALLEKMDPRSSDEIVRDVERSAKGFA